MKGHQPFISPFGLYYCMDTGKDQNGLTNWKICLDGDLLNSGKPLIENTTVECSPHVEFVNNVYVLSFVTRFKKGSYSLGLLTSSVPSFSSVINRRVFSPCPIGSIACDGKIICVHTTETGFVFSVLDQDTLIITMRKYVSMDWDKQHVCCKVSCIQDTYSRVFLLTFICPSNESCFFTVAYNPTEKLISEHITTSTGQEIYKSSWFDNRFVHAVKTSDNFEDRELIEENVDTMNFKWQACNETDFVYSETIERFDESKSISLIENRP